MKICLPLDGQQVCFEIPVLIEKWHWPLPDPGPLDPGSFIHSSGDASSANPIPWKTDLVALNTIALAAQALSDKELGQTFVARAAELAAGVIRDHVPGAELAPSGR